MDYKTYCKKNRIDPRNAASAKMFYFYKEAEAASTDCNIKKEPMYANCTTAMINYNANVGYDVFLAPISPQDKPCASVPCAKNKGNNPMYVDNDKHLESSKINYLTDRAATSYSKKRGDMITTFNLDTPAVPATPELLVEAITSGKYQIKPKAERNQYDRVTNQIIWRSADIKADQAGYEKALTDLQVVYTDIKDSIAVGTPADAMTKIKALDAWTPTVGNA